MFTEGNNKVKKTYKRSFYNDVRKEVRCILGIFINNKLSLRELHTCIAGRGACCTGGTILVSFSLPEYCLQNKICS